MSSAWRGVLADIDRTATPRGRARLGRLSIEGTRLHERALRAGVAIEACLVAERGRDSPDPRVARLLEQLRDSGTRVHVVPDAVLDERTEGRSLGPLLGLVPIPSQASLAERLGAGEVGQRLLLVAVDVEDPGNVGALMRTGLASGVAAFVATGISDPFHPRAVRTSMGSLFKLPIARFSETASLVEELTTLGVRTLGARARGGVPLPELDPGAGSWAVCLGNEAFGLDSSAADLDVSVTVPMAPGIDSYSVNAAAAILLYALRHPRAGGPAGD